MVDPTREAEERTVNLKHTLSRSPRGTLNPKPTLSNRPCPLVGTRTSLTIEEALSRLTRTMDILVKRRNIDLPNLLSSSNSLGAAKEVACESRPRRFRPSDLTTVNLWSQLQHCCLPDHRPSSDEPSGRPSSGFPGRHRIRPSERSLRPWISVSLLG